MNVQGSNCSIVIKTVHSELDVPYSEETIREAVSMLQEEAAIEGDGTRRAIRKDVGVSGCIVSPLTIRTAPLLLYLAMGSVGLPLLVTETRNLYQYRIELLPFEDSDCFDLIQDRNGEKRIFNDCRVISFELRIVRDETIKLKFDISGECSLSVYPFNEVIKRGTGERFSGENVSYKINGNKYHNIYGLTMDAKKEGGTRTELWIKRVLDKEADLPEIIEELVITAQLMRDKYEYRYYGTFRITLKHLVLVSDETSINSADTVIGPLRYYVTGSVITEVFSNSDFLVGV